jgi:hypothetical protein
MTPEEKHTYENPTPWWESVEMPEHERREHREAFRRSQMEESERQKKKSPGNRTQKKSSSSRSPKSSVAEDLSVLEGMLERGTLTKEEFQIAKREVLGGSHDTPTPAAHRRKTRKGRKAPKLKPGDKVKHPSFGTGVVLKISGSGKKEEITVRFAKHGIKVLAGAFAPLRRST